MQGWHRSEEHPRSLPRPVAPTSPSVESTTSTVELFDDDNHSTQVMELAQQATNVTLSDRTASPKPRAPSWDQSVRYPGSKAPSTAFRQAPFERVRLVPASLTAVDVYNHFASRRELIDDRVRWHDPLPSEFDFSSFLESELLYVAHVTVEGKSAEELDVSDELWLAMDDIGTRTILPWLYLRTRSNVKPTKVESLSTSHAIFQKLPSRRGI
ncbi:hypothetical protein ACM66B_001193 [Microbotryomycetes sp. NB124-2]